MKRLLVVIHPFLLAAFFILALYSTNVAEVSPCEIWIPLLIALGFTFLLLSLIFLAIGLIPRLHTSSELSDPRKVWDIKKPSIIASMFIILFFSFGPILYLVGRGNSIVRVPDDPTYWFILSIIWIAVFVCAAYFLVKTRRNLYKLSMVINIVAITLVIIPTINIVLHETKATGKFADWDDNMKTYKVDLKDTHVLPDIYYIVPDWYASARTLEEVYDFDNSDFLDYLSSKGFYVDSESVSNYPCTTLSLPSSLNMDFLHEEFADCWDSYHMSLRDFAVWRILKSLGYMYIHFGASWGPTSWNPYADINNNYHGMYAGFSSYVFQLTWAYPIGVLLNLYDSFPEQEYKAITQGFEQLAKIPELTEPTFVFAHLFTPHPSFVFDKEGGLVPRTRYDEEDLSIMYIDQVIATNNMLKNLIDALLSRSEVPPIIIVQADEGPRPDRFFNILPTSPEWLEANEEEWRTKYGILNAYYLPSVDQNSWYPSITPVNSFRLVFNLYFNTAFKLLPDRSYAYSKECTPLFFDVTDKVRYE